ncbi:MAG: aldose 1-epimerase family protein [Clostridia bacterium]|nr:aldose 1-epimerase family protein [Clostridia bacterium]
MLEIKVNKLGAELTSIKLDGIEKLHQAQSHWKRHAPILFPIVGQIKDGQTIINGKIYKMGQHGFARDMEFEEIEPNTFLLKYSKETLEKYPFRFELCVKYTIENDELTTTYKVINKDLKTMCFGLGGHPAFICDYTSGDFQISFNEIEKDIQFMQLENGLISNEKAPNLLNNNALDLLPNIFEKDAIIMKNIKSNTVTLYNKKQKIKVLEFDFTGFPYLAFWSKIGAPFVCIEPWFNTTDHINSNGKFEDKENILTLEPNEKFECKYKIKFY